MNLTKIHGNCFESLSTSFGYNLSLKEKTSVFAHLDSKDIACFQLKVQKFSKDCWNLMTKMSQDKMVKSVLRKWTRARKLHTKWQAGPRQGMLCKSWEEEASFSASKNYNGRVTHDFEGHSPEWRVLSKCTVVSNIIIIVLRCWENM